MLLVFVLALAVLPPRLDAVESVDRKRDEAFLQYLNRVDNLYCGGKHFCEKPSKETIGLNVKPQCGSQCPIQCYCDDVCSQFGDCCPNKDTENYLQTSPDTYSCVSADLKRRSGNNYLYKMITSCPLNFSDVSVIAKCNESQTSDEVDARRAVTSSELKTYGNRYCALCNKAQNFSEWIVEPLCQHLISFPSDTKPSQILEIILKHDACTLQLIPPTDDIARSMRTCSVDSGVEISTCNVTGFWVFHNPDIEKACRSYDHGFAGRYRNPFCFLCNSDEAYFSCATGFGPVQFVPFSSILDFSSDHYEPQPTCRRGFRYDSVQKFCREIFCAEGKWLKDGGKCITVLRPTKPILFKLSVVYTITSIEEKYFECPTRRDLLDVIIPSLSKNLSTQFCCKALQIYKSTMTALCRPTHIIRWVDDSPFAGEILDTIVFTAQILYEDDGQIDVDTVEDRLLNMTYANHSISGYHDCVLRSEERKTDQFRRSHQYSSIVEYTPVLVQGSSHSPQIKKETTVTIDIGKLRTCAYVILGEEEFEVTNDSVLYITSLNVFLNGHDFVKLNESSMGICSESYFNIAGKLSLPGQDTLILGKITLVCTCLSVLCLLLTLIIYCLMKHLRTQPGKNNMSLVTSLMLAQALFVGTSNQKIVCMVLGIAKHYLWMSALLWMNVCSFHMFRVFVQPHSARNHSTTVSKSNLRLYYYLYCFLIPIVLVCCNAFISFIATGSVGYAAPYCFISSRQLHIYTFGLPVGIVVVSNICMFIVVIISIHRTASSTRIVNTDNHHLHVYFRLSTLTGATWAFGYVHLLTEEVLFSYLFTISNTLQGVFLFVAFVCNRRSFKALKDRFSSPMREGKIDGGTASTVNKTSTADI